MPDSADNASFRRRALVATAIGVGALILVYFIWQAAYVLLLVFAGVLLAIFLRSLAEGLMRVVPRLPMKAALTIVILVLLAVSVITIWLMAPNVAEQVDELGKQLPQAVKTLKEKAASYPAAQRVMNSATWQKLFDPQGSQVLARATKFASGTLNALLAVVLVLFIGFYFAFEPTVYTNGILRLVPRDKRERGAQIIGSVGYTLRWFLIAQFIDMWIIGIATTLGLWMLGVPLALVFGILAGLFNIIPNFGPLISLIPATLIALTVSPQTAMYVIILYMVLQSIEGYLLLPLLQRKAVDLPPVLTIAAQVLMGIQLGGLGLLLAAPLMAAMMVVVKMLYVEEALGDDIDTPEDKLNRKDLPPVPGKKKARTS